MMNRFGKGQKVIKIFRTGDLETGCLRVVAKVGPAWVQLKGDDHLRYNASTGAEIDPAPGFAAAGISSRIISVDE